MFCVDIGIEINIRIDSRNAEHGEDGVGCVPQEYCIGAHVNLDAFTHSRIVMALSKVAQKVEK